MPSSLVIGECPPTGRPESERKSYVAPRLVALGNLGDLTRGMGGSRMDHGHETPSKMGVG